MKTLTYKTSSICNGEEHTYYVSFSDIHPTWNYTYRATEEGFGHFLNICKEAGYTLICQDY